jgi:RNA polymerase sigma-B factor
MHSTPDGKLTEEQIQSLLAEYAATQNVRLRDKVVLQYNNLVESIARRFANSGEPLEDLVQEGFIGLITATDLYNADKGVKFSTYATYFIIGRIKHALRDRGKMIKEPAWLQELNYRMAKVIDSLCQELGRQPTEAEIGRVMHLPEETVTDLLTTREIFKVASLDSEQDEASPGVIDVDKVKDERCTMFQLPVEDKIVLEMAMNKLKLIEQKVIQEFYYTGMSQTEIAKKLGISCNYVSHILRAGTRKLRRILTTEEIKEMQMQLQLASRRSESLAAQLQANVVDSLTGLYSREYLESRLEEELIRAARHKSKVSFAVVLIDGLDPFGAKFGSMRREDALYGLARLVRDSVRKCDVVGRVGTQEFGLILPHTGKQADQVCERVRRAILNAGFDTGRQSTRTFEPVIGYATYPVDATAVDELIDLAFGALDQQRELPKAA